jgi:hypothetical protein
MKSDDIFHYLKITTMPVASAATISRWRLVEDSGLCGDARGFSRCLWCGIVQRRWQYSLYGVGTRCGFPRWLVSCRMEAALVGWCGGGRSRMLVTSSVPVVVHGVASLGFGCLGCRAKALPGP